MHCDNSRVNNFNSFKHYLLMSLEKLDIKMPALMLFRCEPVAAGKCRRPLVTQTHDSKIKFPLPRR